MFISSAFFTRVDWKRFMNYATPSRTPALEPTPTALAALRRTLVCSRNETQRTTKLICKFNEYARSRRSWSRRRGSCRKKLSSELNHPLPSSSYSTFPSSIPYTHDRHLAEQELTLGAVPPHILPPRRICQRHRQRWMSALPVPPLPLLGPLACSDLNE